MIVYQQENRLFAYPITSESMVIGRASSCDLILTGESVSRQHAIIEKRDGHYWITNTSSTGTRVNEEYCTKTTRLENRAVIEMSGGWKLVFEEGAAAVPASSEDAPTTLNKMVVQRGETVIMRMAQNSDAVKMIAPVLVVEGKTGNRRTIPLKNRVFVIGTGEDCDVRIEDPFVSKRHLEARLTENGLLICDLGSTNGTWMDELKIREGILKKDQSLRIGETRLHLLLNEKEEEKIIPAEEERFCGMVGRSRAMRLLYSKIKRVAPTDMTVLIHGESGTGKELVARALHDLSSRRAKPFVVINCAAISPNLVESELFGHEKGAFTGAEQRHPGAFEQASGGTLFLDEIGELSLDLQAKILRTLEYQTVRRVGGTQEVRIDVRVVTATHRNLSTLVSQGKFREDLYFRLYVVALELPSLRDRREDIPLLVATFCQQQAKPVDLAPDVLDLLKAHEWPGNVRELRHTIARALTFSRNNRINRQDIEFIPLRNKTRRDMPSQPQMQSGEASAGGITAAGPGEGVDLLNPEACDDFERQRINQALTAAGGDKIQAAHLLGMGRSTLFRKLKELGM